MKNFESEDESLGVWRSGGNGVFALLCVVLWADHVQEQVCCQKKDIELIKF